MTRKCFYWSLIIRKKSLLYSLFFAIPRKCLKMSHCDVVMIVITAIASAVGYRHHLLFFLAYWKMPKVTFSGCLGIASPEIN